MKMTPMKEDIQGHYEVEEVPCGRVYKWVPGHTLQDKPLTEDDVYRPEQKAYEEWLRDEEAHPYLKHYEWLELEALRG